MPILSFFVILFSIVSLHNDVMQLAALSAEPVDTVAALMAADKRFKAFKDLQGREKEFQLQQAIKKRKQTAAMRLSDKPNRRTSRLGVKAVLGVLDNARGESKGFNNVFGDPSFQRAQEEADRSEMMRTGCIAGDYDEHGRKLAKRDLSMGPRVMSRMASKLPYYSNAEIADMNKHKSAALGNAAGESDDRSLGSSNSMGSEEDDQFSDDGFGIVTTTFGRTEGNYPPLGPLTDSSVPSPSKLRDGWSGDKVQATLIKIWDILNVPTIRRVEFMAKYSTQSYFASLPEAVNLWGQAAMYCTARSALMTVCRNIQKNENIPVSTNSFLGIIDEVISATATIPMLAQPKVKKDHTSAAEAYLQRRRSAFVRLEQPPNIKVSLKAVFTSALFLEHFNPTSSVLDMKAAAEAAKSADSTSKTLEAAKEKATAFFKGIQHHIDSNISSITSIVRAFSFFYSFCIFFHYKYFVKYFSRRSRIWMM